MAPPAGQIRPGRYLAVFAVIVAALYALVFLTGNGKPVPKLGIDLQGGTMVILSAQPVGGKPPTAEAIGRAKGIIEDRVNGKGVSGAEVVRDQNNLVITAPGDNSDSIKDVGDTALLRIRPVLTSIPNQDAPLPPTGTSGAPTPSTSGAPTSSAPAPTSGKPQGRPAPEQPATTTPSTPATSTSAKPTATPGPNDEDPEHAAAVAKAKAQRQPEGEAAQTAALQAYRCDSPNVLGSNDDTSKPLIACDTEKAFKYLLGPTVIEGTEIGDASSGQGDKGVGWQVNLTFKSKGADLWAKFTAANVNKQAAFALDSVVQSAPTINSAIPGGNTQISGQFTQKQVADLAGVLKYGALPVAFKLSDTNTVSATLGLASLEAGLLAGGIGLLLVLIYCLIYYRVLGVLTLISLGLSAALVYACVVLLGRWLGYSLDLAGVAGFIVAIGITADSFVVFFERLKDEVREGRSFRSAVPRAWVRGRRTILSADAVFFLASAVLYLLAVGQVKGFAFTLGMSTVLDLVIVFLVTHPLVVLASRNKTLSKPSLSGLGAIQNYAATHRTAPAGAAGRGEA
ncbi:protein translocase subunit SecD [Pseudonocardiaceae bacterium YIM PH 21723]|nr:protein translocase subunit SecD [Pseudonocardiaceae bacterium YIM PH 21723]